MLEAEYAFSDSLEQLCDLVERYLNFVVSGMHSSARIAEEFDCMAEVFCDRVIYYHSFYKKYISWGYIK